MPAHKCSNSGCEYFNRPLPNNMECCPGCGRPLTLNPPINSASVSPQPVPPPEPPQNLYVQEPRFVEDTSYQRRSPYTPPTSPAQPPRPVRPALKLIHTITGREFNFLKEDGYIGRRSQIHGTVPEIDLVGIPHEGIVSRSHARIFWDWNQNSYVVLDNKSTNGSYLNGNLLEQGVGYPLTSGDSLQLGQEGLVKFTVLVV